MESCHSCGGPIRQEYRFCPNCGAPKPSAHLPLRVPSGIVGVDELVEGGFEAGKTYLVAGETGTGKTIFSIQYLLRGLKDGEPGIYVTIDERPERLVLDVRRFGWNLEDPVRLGRLMILPVRQYFTAKLWGREMDAIVNSITTELRRRAREIGARRLVIDPVAPLVASYNPGLPMIREYIRSLVFSLENEVGTTNIITSEVPTGDNSISRYGVEEFLASGIIVLGLAKMGNRIVRTLYIRKMRWTSVEPVIQRFDIEGGRGIVLRGPLE